MKRLYIGLTVSLVLIVGGIAVTKFYKPAVNMADLGRDFYTASNQYEMSKNNKIDCKLISIKDDSLKVELDLKDYSGSDELLRLIEQSFYLDKSSNDNYKKDVEDFFSTVRNGKRDKDNKDKVKMAKSEVVTYKWVDKPFNISIAKINYKSIKHKNGSEITYEEFEVIDKENTALTSSVNVKDAYGLRINGIRGKGILQVEYKVVY